MVRILAVADEVVESLPLGLGFGTSGTAEAAGSSLDGPPELILGAGDLPFRYLEQLAARFEVPCVFVPGNHDRSLDGYRRGRTGWTKDSMPVEDPGPRGAVNADGRTVRVGGIQIAGLGGCRRYNGGPNQYTERAQAWRGRRLLLTAALTGRRRPEVLLTHSPARGVGDGDDEPHWGFDYLHRLVHRLRPKVLIHGHVHPFGRPAGDLHIGATVSMNVVGYCLFDLNPETGTITILRRKHGS